MRQDFFLEGQYLGTAARSMVQADRDVFGSPLSTGFFCRVCGKAYAHCPVYRPDGGQTAWRMISGVCSRCPADGINPPGSIWHYPDHRFQLEAPAELLRAELALHLNAFDKETARHGHPSK